MASNWKADQDQMLKEIAQSVHDLSQQNLDRMEQFHATICSCPETDKEECRTLYVKDCLVVLMEITERAIHL